MSAPNSETGPGSRDPSSAGPTLPSRRAAIGRGALAIVAACAPAACGRPQPRPAPVAAPVRRRETELAWLEDGAARIVVAGEPLDVPLLRRFYARRDFEPVWRDRPRQADALAHTVQRAADHGLEPERFYAGLLHRRATLPALRRELLITHAVLTYADALAKGAVPPDRRAEGEALEPDPIDVAAVLDAALDQADPAAVIEALAPATPTYAALRQALKRPQAGFGAGRLREVKVNLERQRWLPRSLPADRVWVNVADQQLVLYQADRPVFSTRVIVGEASEPNQSPEFRTMIEGSWFNPPWIVPRDIVEAEYLPRIARDPNYLTRNNMVLRENGEIEQLPGPNAGLGAIMFDMPNRFDVYLHDTPGRALFRRGNRRISHGCIRVQNPVEFAALLLQQPVGAVRDAIAKSGTVRQPLPRPTPVFIVYQTAFADGSGRLQFRPDFYRRDAGVLRRLQGGRGGESDDLGL